MYLQFVEVQGIEHNNIIKNWFINTAQINEIKQKNIDQGIWHINRLSQESMAKVK